MMGGMGRKGQALARAQCSKEYYDSKKHETKEDLRTYTVYVSYTDNVTELVPLLI